MPVTVIAHEKGGDLNDKARRNFGSAHPEGYRKALRLMNRRKNSEGPFFASWIRREPSAASEPKPGAKAPLLRKISWK